MIVPSTECSTGQSNIAPSARRFLTLLNVRMRWSRRFISIRCCVFWSKLIGQKLRYSKCSKAKEGGCTKTRIYIAKLSSNICAALWQRWSMLQIIKNLMKTKASQLSRSTGAKLFTRWKFLWTRWTWCTTSRNSDYNWRLMKNLASDQAWWPSRKLCEDVSNFIKWSTASWKSSSSSP